MTLREKIIMRLEKGISSAAIAQECCCSVQYVNRISDELGYNTIEKVDCKKHSSNFSEDWKAWFSNEWTAACNKLRRCVS